MKIANISVSLDKRLIDNNDLFKEKEKRGELLIAERSRFWPPCAYHNQQK